MVHHFFMAVYHCCVCFLHSGRLALNRVPAFCLLPGIQLQRAELPKSLQETLFFKRQYGGPLKLKLIEMEKVCMHVGKQYPPVAALFISSFPLQHPPQRQVTGFMGEGTFILWPIIRSAGRDSLHNSVPLGCLMLCIVNATCVKVNKKKRMSLKAFFSCVPFSLY